MRTRKLTAALALGALSCAAPGIDRTPDPRPGRLTPLDEYVRAPDPAYAWKRVATREGEGWVAHVLELESQSWRTPSDVDSPLWRHWLTILVPAGASGDVGMLYLTGGRNGDPPPAGVDPLRLRLALATSTVVAELRMVPNQPLLFAGESEPLRENALIAYGWERFLAGGGTDPTWLPQLPMTKAAVRAMDAVTEFCASPEGGGLSVRRFVVAGRSKRGWTSWTTAAVDRRVVAIVPMVIDLLNIETSFEHHYRAYGFWSPAIDEYVDRNIPDYFGTSEMRALRAIVEPYEYRERLGLPKFLINGTGDEFFLPDSSRFYFDDLPGEKHLRYVPNAGHGLEESDALDSLVAFYRAIVRGRERPRYSFRFPPDGSIEVRTKGARVPSEVLLWQATNAKARDFRTSTLGKGWVAEPLAPSTDGHWVARVEPPVEGWTAFFVELTFPGDGPEAFKFTTGVRVVPDTLPYDPPERGTATVFR